MGIRSVPSLPPMKLKIRIYSYPSVQSPSAHFWIYRLVEVTDRDRIVCIGIKEHWTLALEEAWRAYAEEYRRFGY